MKHEIIFCNPSFIANLPIHARISELRMIQYEAQRHNVDINNSWIEEEIKDLQVSLKGCL